ncbi:MAG: hypothetical protein HKO71_04320 [Pseudomonadales bacterium]|nr:hypothetical protein [Pseudomonadales bacterium]
MNHSLIPERAVLVSPSLAASIGLEEAILLQHLENCCQLAQGMPGHDLNSNQQQTEAGADATELAAGYQWARGSLQALAVQLPFWAPASLRRILQSLVDLGMLVLNTFPQREDQVFAFAINQPSFGRDSKAHVPRQPPVGQAHNQGLGGQRITAQWQPSEALITQLQQQGVDPDFSLASVDEFVLYWRERNEISHSWSSKFLQHVSRRWQQEQQREQDRKLRVQREASQLPANSQGMQTGWQPSLDAIEILLRMGINQNFIDDAVPEFVLYWQERGDAQTTWNSKFVTQVKRQWARYTHALKHDTEPVPMRDGWQPDHEVFDVLAIANIDQEFARQLIPEFMMYWRDKNELHHSWNTKFLQYVKHQWSRNYQAKEQSNHARAGQTGEKRRTRDRTLLEDLTDRSWAS